MVRRNHLGQGTGRKLRVAPARLNRDPPEADTAAQEREGALCKGKPHPKDDEAITPRPNNDNRPNGAKENSSRQQQERQAKQSSPKKSGLSGRREESPNLHTCQDPSCAARSGTTRFQRVIGFKEKPQVINANSIDSAKSRRADFFFLVFH